MGGIICSLFLCAVLNADRGLAQEEKECFKRCGCDLVVEKDEWPLPCLLAFQRFL